MKLSFKRVFYFWIGQFASLSHILCLSDSRFSFLLLFIVLLVVFHILAVAEMLEIIHDCPKAELSVKF